MLFIVTTSSSHDTYDITSLKNLDMEIKLVVCCSFIVAATNGFINMCNLSEQETREEKIFP